MFLFPFSGMLGHGQDNTVAQSRVGGGGAVATVSMGITWYNHANDLCHSGCSAYHYHYFVRNPHIN